MASVDAALSAFDELADSVTDGEKKTPKPKTHYGVLVHFRNGDEVVVQMARERDVRLHVQKMADCREDPVLGGYDPDRNVLYPLHAMWFDLRDVLYWGLVKWTDDDPPGRVL